MEYTCSYCGFSSDSLEDFEEDFQYHQGFWCPLCDGFTYYDKNKDKRSYTVLLEYKEYIDARKIRSKIHLKKQVSPLRKDLVIF